MAYREDNFYEGLADRKEQIKIKSNRKKSFLQRSVSNKEFSGTADDGWRISKELITSTQLIKDKRKDKLFEDKIWVLLQSMNFEYMSKDENFIIHYGNDTETQQIDVFAMNEDVAIILECKSSFDNEIKKTSSFKKYIEAMNSQRNKIMKLIRNATRNKDLTVVFAFAFENIKLNSADKKRMNEHGIKCFDDGDVEYYSSLVKELGDVARYQFQADLLGNQKIPSINNEVFAIKSKVGKNYCYTFSIEPDRLLKLGYILHHKRDDNSETITYQRILKKSRLKSIRKFVEQGGYFPNSLIVNINTGRKTLNFKPSSPKDLAGSQTKIGILELPQKYKSIYIIDGQHRLYSYADSKSNLSKKVTVPVVAFVNLSGDEQLDMFMNINQNQKSVSANLRITLEADLKFGSSNLADAAVGLKNRVALDLGEKETSPLYGRVLVGEEKSTDPIKFITLTSICNGLKETKIIGKFTEHDAIKGQFGLFYSSDKDKTKELERISGFLFKYFNYIKDNCCDEWYKGKGDKPIICSPDGIDSLIRILGSILDHIKQEYPDATYKNFFDLSEEYFSALAECINNITDDKRLTLTEKLGGSAPNLYYRTYQQYLSKRFKDYNPLGLEKFLEESYTELRIEVFTILTKIENIFQKHVHIYAKENCDQNKTEDHRIYERKFFNNTSLGIMKKINENNKFNLALENPDFRFCDCLYLIDYRTIFENYHNHNKNFQVDYFKKFAEPEFKNDKKEKAYKYLVRLNDIRSNCDHEKGVDKVTSEDLAFVKKHYEWIIKIDF